MAFPTDYRRSGAGTTTAGTSHNYVFDATPQVGELLIVFMRFAAAPGTITFTGYTSLVSDSSDASDDTTAIYWRVATGSGDAPTLTTANSVKSAVITWQIVGAASTTPFVSTVAISAAANINPPAVSPGSSNDYLFLTAIGMDHETATATAPTGYSNNQISTNSGTGGAVATNCQIWGASKGTNASVGNASTNASAATCQQDQKLAQSFVAPGNGQAIVCTFSYAKSGTPTDIATFTIEADSAGQPSGTPLATGFFNTGQAAAIYTILLTPSASLTSGATYWIVFARGSGSGDAQWVSNSTNPYANGKLRLFSAGSWSDVGGGTWDGYFNVTVRDQGSAASSEDPAAWTSTAPSTGASAWTIAVAPPAPGSPGPASSRRQRRASRYLTFR